MDMAKTHYAFPQLFNIYEILEDYDGLYNDMRVLGVRPKLHNHEPFSRWVFRHLKNEVRLDELLDLPNSFDEQLLEFLRPYPELLWRIQVWLVALN